MYHDWHRNASALLALEIGHETLQQQAWAGWQLSAQS